jgi:hypothetical protein
MGSFPLDVGFQLAGYGRDASSVVERSDMERGPAKTRRTATDLIVTINGKLFFRSNAIQLAFDDWFYGVRGANGGAAWFNWLDPRDGTAREARIVSLGTLSPIALDFSESEQPCVLEYVRRVES